VVDYKKFLSGSKEERPTDPFEIFNRLGVKVRINDLYQSQREVLAEWNSRRTSKDLVVKLHTGGGKTLVGMLIGTSIMNETGKGVIYLVPNNQLADQAYNKAVSYGIPVALFGEDNPDPISDDILKGKKILVATYKALFNAKSRFGILNGNKEIIHVGGIIVDDAHSSFSEIRDSFSIRLKKIDKDSAYNKMVSLFRSVFSERGELGTLNDIVSGVDNGILEIPYWAWDQKFVEVQSILDQIKGLFPFTWSLIRDRLRECYSIIGKDEITVTPLFPPVRMIPTFADCPRRVYMSATLNDDSPIIENFDADPDSIKNPISAKTLAGIGERMIIIPKITKLKYPEEADEKIVQKFSKRGFGIVILVPSKFAAEKWEKLGETYADTTKKVDEYVKLLIDRKSDGPYVFANRYDGIDLQGDSCRILILDGLPSQSGEYEKYEARVMTGSTFLSSLISVRIEQGIGRATRGRGDYSVVILTGNSLPAWISKNYGSMTVGTRTQIKIAFDTTKEITTIDGLYDTISQCINRDPDWVNYHAQELAKLTDLPKSEIQKIEVAGKMRKAFNFADDKQYDRAIANLNSVISSEADDRLKGIAKELQARFAYFWGKFDDSEKYQKAAFALNRNLLRPRTPPPYQRITPKYKQAKSVSDKVLKYQFRRGLIDDFESVTTNLNHEATSNAFEESLKELASFVGLESERPEHTRKEGPDVLWVLPDNKALVMEVKSLKDPENSFIKKDLGQLLVSYEWFKEKYPGYEGLPVSVHLNDKAQAKLNVNSVKVLTLESLKSLISEIRTFLTEICRDELSDADLMTTCENSLKEHGLIYKDIIKKYLKQFQKT
jgi:tetratricopeptide (TPR) repeat protein